MKHGGLNIVSPDERVVDDYTRSKRVCASFSHGDMSTVDIDQQLAIKNVKKDKTRLFINIRKNEIRNDMSENRL